VHGKKDNYSTHDMVPHAHDGKETVWENTSFTLRCEGMAKLFFPVRCPSTAYLALSPLKNLDMYRPLFCQIQGNEIPIADGKKKKLRTNILLRFNPL